MCPPSLSWLSPLLVTVACSRVNYKKHLNHKEKETYTKISRSESSKERHWTSPTSVAAFVIVIAMSVYVTVRSWWPWSKVFFKKHINHEEKETYTKISKSKLSRGLKFPIALVVSVPLRWRTPSTSWFWRSMALTLQYKMIRKEISINHAAIYKKSWPLSSWKSNHWCDGDSSKNEYDRKFDLNHDVE